MRINNRGKTSHPDFMDYMISPEHPEPSTKKELTHIEQVALQMFIAGFDPIQVTLFAALFFLVKYPSTCAILAKEIRDSFSTYEDITPNALVNLKYLQAFIQETLRTHLTGSNGMPRVSPGATVDGVYVPKGVSLLLPLHLIIIIIICPLISIPNLTCI
jgi:cytochrome P450